MKEHEVHYWGEGKWHKGSKESAKKMFDKEHRAEASRREHENETIAEYHDRLGKFDRDDL